MRLIGKECLNCWYLLQTTVKRQWAKEANWILLPSVFFGRWHLEVLGKNVCAQTICLTWHCRRSNFNSYFLLSSAFPSREIFWGKYLPLERIFYWMIHEHSKDRRDNEIWKPLCVAFRDYRTQRSSLQCSDKALKHKPFAKKWLKPNNCRVCIEQRLCVRPGEILTPFAFYLKPKASTEKKTMTILP